MATINYALTTKERVKNRLSISTTDLDTVIDGMIYGITDTIERITGRRFKQATYTNVEITTKPLQDKIFLPNAPVSTVTSFQYNAGTPSNPSWQDFDADSYLLDTEVDAIRMINQTLPVGVNAVRVTYTGGYLIDFDNWNDDASHTLPYDLTDLAERLVSKVFSKRKEEGKSTTNFAESNIVWEALLTAGDKDMLKRFRRFIM